MRNDTLSVEDCNEIVLKHFSRPYKVRDYSLQPISDEVNGFMSSQLLLKICLQDAPKSELRFFAKVLCEDHEAINEYVKTGNLFDKEIYCYKFLEDVKKKFPGFDVSFAPKYYFSRSNKVLILEDLVENGYRMWGESLELDLEHMKLCLQSIAKFHAASLVFEEAKSTELGRKYELTEDYGVWLKESLYGKGEDFMGFRYMQAGIEALCGLTEVVNRKSLTPSEFKLKIWELAVKVYENVKPSKKFRNVWAHGDLWLKNVMFKYQNGQAVDCKIFDFQLQRYNPPVHDVLLVIYQTVSRKNRQRHFHDLLDFYYSSLKCELKKFNIDIQTVLGKDEFDLSARELYNVIKFTKSCYKSLSSISTEALNELTKDPKMYEYVNFHNRHDFAVKIFKTPAEEGYRKMMTDLLEDLEDIVTHEKVSIEDCWKILREALGTAEYDLLDYRIKVISSKMSKLYVKVLKDNEIKELVFVIKEYTIDEKLEQFNKEIQFYKRVQTFSSSHEENCFPKCYLYYKDNIIVTEDCSKGYKTFSTLDDYDAVKTAVKSLARLHVSGFKYHQQTTDEYVDQDIKTILKTYLVRNLKVDVKTLEDVLNYLESRLPFPKTTCHMNLTPDNILFKKQRCIFVNFKFTEAPPALDLLLFLQLSTTKKFRDAHEGNILNSYHGQFVSLLDDKATASLKEFHGSCAQMKGLAIARGLLYFLSCRKGSSDDKASGILLECADDCLCAERLRDCLADVKDFYGTSDKKILLDICS